MELPLDSKEYESVKSSFYNILAFLLKNEEHPENHWKCLTKWGSQLDLPVRAIETYISGEKHFEFIRPSDPMHCLEHVYDLVYMIYLDGHVEDNELELATYYAEGLGFKPHVAGDILKAIVTARADGVPRSEVKEEIKTLLAENAS